MVPLSIGLFSGYTSIGDHYKMLEIASEVIQLIEDGKLTRESIHAEWPDIVAGKVSGRESAEEIIIFIALGIWGEYAAILPEVYRRAKAKGLGRALPI